MVKDGGSSDGSIERLERTLAEWPEGRDRVRIVRRQDKSIYDAMNQAVEEAMGSYDYFLNCGDLFAEDEVLQKVAAQILEDRQSGREAGLYYGDVKDVLRDQVVASNPHIDGFACYRHVPCHQACIYGAELFAERGYDTAYRVRADYEHFLWCFFEKNIRPRYLPVTLADYEGGGFSETKENLRVSEREHREITARYMTPVQRLCYRLILLVTLAPLRRKMAESPKFAGVYQRMKRALYGGKK